MKLPIYLDYSATTPVDPRVAEKMMQFMTMDGTFGNPASRSHRFGWQAEEAVDIARNQIADLVGADPREIVFTSGATESDNLAIKGAANFYQKKGKHIITSKTEHKAVLDTCRQLEREGFEVTYLAPQRSTLKRARYRWLIFPNVREFPFLIWNNCFPVCVKMVWFPAYVDQAVVIC